MRRWFISHPSSAPDRTPVFLSALQYFNAEHVHDLELLYPPRKLIDFQSRRAQLEQADLVIAEVSVPSTGSGVELGLAHAAEKPVIAFHQGTTVMSPVIQTVATAIHVYITDEHIYKVLKTLF